MAYASPAQLATLLGLGADGFNAAQTERAQLLLDMATAEIERVTGQTLVDGVADLVLTGAGACKLVLPRWPVTEVASVAEVDADTGAETALVHRVDYTWTWEGILTRVGGVWPRHDGGVHAVIRAGFDPISMDVVRVCLAMCQRAWPNPKLAAEERLGDHSIKYAAGGVEPTASERETLRTYVAKTRP